MTVDFRRHGLGSEPLGGYLPPGVTAYTGAVTRTVTISVAAAGVLGKVGAVTRTVTISVTAAGTLGRVGGATRSISITVTAAGTVTAGFPGGANPSLAFGVVAAGVVGAVGGATRSLSISVAAAGVLGLFGGATPTIGIGVVAAGSTAQDYPGGATRSISITAVAAGTVLTGPGALPVIGFTVEAAGVVLVAHDTQLIFGAGGRRRSGTLAAEFQPDPVAAPVSVAATIRRIAVHAIDSFTITGPHREDVAVEFRTVTKAAPTVQIIAGHRDISFFRGAETPMPELQLLSPGRYGPGRLVLPQIKAAWERPGHGDLTWLYKLAPIIVRIHDDDGWHVIFRGSLSDEDRSGPDYAVTLLGQLSGRAGIRWRSNTGFPTRRDLSTWIVQTIRTRLRLPAKGPAGGTGIMTSQNGEQYQWDWLTGELAQSTMLGGNQWTVEPNDNGVYWVQRKDTATIHWTLYPDDAHTVFSLRRDYTEEDNEIYAEAVDPDGARIDGLVIPGMAGYATRPDYPMAGGASFGAGTTDADTLSGAGVTTLTYRLWLFGYVDDPSTVYDAELTRGVRRMQLVADLDEHVDTVLGVVDERTWRRLFNGDVIGWSLRAAQIAPMAQDPRIARFIRDASGMKIARNKRFDPSVMPVARKVSMGTGKTPKQVHGWAEALLDDGTPNLVGTVDINMGGVIVGQHNPGDPLTPDMVKPSLLIRPNQNLWVPHLRTAGSEDEATLLHVVGANHTGGKTQLTIDTRHRDTQEVWEVNDRNRAARVHPGRIAWVKQQRSSGVSRDQMTVWDRFGGIVDGFRPVSGHTWTVIPVRAGREGQIMRFRISLRNDRPEFVIAVFGRHVTGNRLHQLVPAPLTADGRRDWRRHSEVLTETHVLLTAAGFDSNPLGFHPTTKPDHADDFPAKTEDQARTGDWRDDGSYPYRCFGPPVVWLAIYTDRDSVLQPGRLFRVSRSDQV